MRWVAKTGRAEGEEKQGRWRREERGGACWRVCGFRALSERLAEGLAGPDDILLPAGARLLQKGRHAGQNKWGLGVKEE